MLSQKMKPLSTLFALCLILSLQFHASAQNPDEAERQRALSLLWQESRPEEALPLLEKLAQNNPADGEVLFAFGLALTAHAKLLKDPESRKSTRMKARTLMQRARDLGLKHPLLISVLESMPPDGGRDEVFSQNKSADDAMREGEMEYVKGNFSAAAVAYQRALEADPKLYEAPLFTGDMYLKLNQIDKAEEWYERAIKIDPDRETAYRYSATPLMRQGKLEAARARYIEAAIAEPYNRLVWAGLNRWADTAGVALRHPQIDIPSKVQPADSKVTLTVDPKMFEDEEDGTGTSSWLMYGLTRASWVAGEFSKAYPKETTYRHSLREEVAALSMVVRTIKDRQTAGKIKKLNQSLASLVKLSDEGLLEPFVLFALADQGIAADYVDYRTHNREKLRLYLVEYVTSGK